MNKMEAFINALKQPSTVKGILGILGVISFKFSLKPILTPEDLSTVVEGLATIYFLIAIFWQKS